MWNRRRGSTLPLACVLFLLAGHGNTPTCRANPRASALRTLGPHQPGRDGSLCGCFEAKVTFRSFGESVVYGVPLAIRLVLLIPTVTGILSLAIVVLALVAWVPGTWPFVGRLAYSLMAPAAAVYVLVAAYWNVGGWTF